MRLIIETQYLPTITLYSYLNDCKNIDFELYENYQKGGLRNRTFILGANGVIPLTIPLEEGRTQRKPISEIRIANTTNWQMQHWRAIESSYRRSPWFEYYGPELKTFYSRKYDLLKDWNLELFNWTMKKINLTSIEVGFTSTYIKTYDANGFLDLRNKLHPDQLKKYNPKPYPQVFSDRHGFIPNLSIIDLLMNEGKLAIKYI